MFDILFSYWGIDWLIFLLLTMNLWMIGQRKRVAFVYGILVGILSIVFGIMIGSVAMVVMNCWFIFLHGRNWWKWGSQNV